MPLPIRERDIEAKVVRYAKSRKLFVRKLSSPGSRGTCDRLIIGPKGTLFLELKAPKQVPTPLQRKFLEEVNAQKAPSVVGLWADSVEQACFLIDICCL